MSDKAELATAYVTLIPVMQGAEKSITDELVPGAEAAGTEAGNKAGKGLINGLKAAALIAGAVALGKAVYDIGAQFDDMADTIRVGTGATGDALDSLVASAQNVGKVTPASFSDIGTVVADLNTRLGLTGSTLELVAQQALEAGRITGEALDLSTVTASFNAFGLKETEVSDAMDTLFQVSQATGISMNQLSSIIADQAPALQNLGFSFEESASMAGILDKAGIDASSTMAAMGKGLVTLAKEGEEPQAAFRRVTAEIDALVKSGDIAGALDLASGIFGTKAANKFVGAVQSGTLELDNLIESVGMSGDSILGVAADTADFAEKWELVKNNAALAIQPLASGVFDALANALSFMMPYLTSFGEWLSDNQWVLGVVAGVVGVTLVAAFLGWASSAWTATVAMAASAKATALNVANLAKQAAGWVASKAAMLAAAVAQKAVTAAQWLMNAAMSANPIGLIIAAIVALVAGFVILWNKSEAFRNFFIGIWEGIKAAAQAVADWFMNTVVPFFQGIWDSIVEGVTSFGQGVSDFFTGLWEGIKAVITTVWDFIVGYYTGLWDTITGVFTTAGDAISGFLSGIWNGIKTVATTVWDAIVGFVTGIPDRIMAGLQFLANLAGKALQWFGGVKDAAMDKLGEAVEWVKGIPGRIMDALGNLGSKLFGSGKELIQGFINGIKNMIGKVTDAVGGILNKVRDFFPFSPAKQGPFSGKGWVLYSGESTGEAYAEGIQNTATKAVSSARGLVGGVSDIFGNTSTGTIALLDAHLTKTVNASIQPMESTAAQNHVINITIEHADLSSERSIEQTAQMLGDLTHRNLLAQGKNSLKVVGG